jgi:fermentation-respiration switch protein FrsA (DUF1100 family)
LLLVVAQSPVAAQTGVKRAIPIRGKPQDVYYYPASSTPPRGKILIAPGDGGWRGFAVDIAQAASSWGYDVYGFDTKHYLESFTSKTTLSESEVMNDMRSVAFAIRRDDRDRVVFVGWSEGAGLGVLAAAAGENKSTFHGLVAIGLGNTNVLGWRWADNITYVTRQLPNEPSFSARTHLANISPLPLFMIHSSRDEYTPAKEAQKLFEAARQPKRLSVIEAQNHRFDGNRDEFFRVLREAVEWVRLAPR